MVKKGFAYHCSIQKDQPPGVPVKLLQGRDSFRRHLHPLGFIILPDPVMGFLLVILLQKILPFLIQFLQGMHLRHPYFRNELVYFLVEFFNFSLGLTSPRFRMKDADSKSCKGCVKLVCGVLRPIIEIAGITFSVL